MAAENVLGFNQLVGTVAASLKNYIIVIDGDSQSKRMHWIWTYNVYTEQWRKYTTPESKTAPALTIGGCAAGIGSDVYMFGGILMAEESLTNALWKLSQSSDEKFVWSHVNFVWGNNIPSPCTFHTGWEYDNQLWVFGGSKSPPLMSYNDDELTLDGISDDCTNHVFSFNPFSNRWTNVKCSGAVPEPRAWHATTVTQNKAWVYGGLDSTGRPTSGFHELNMHSLTWSQIKMGTIKPKERYQSSLTAVSDTQLVLHCGSRSHVEQLDDTWIWDVTSHSWRQHVSNKDHPRAWHTASRGSNKNVIIIGGYWNSATNGTTKNIYYVKLEPKSLQHIALLNIHRNHHSLPWSHLPPKLIALLGMYGTRHLTGELSHAIVKRTK